MNIAENVSAAMSQITPYGGEADLTQLLQIAAAPILGSREKWRQYIKKCYIMKKILTQALFCVIIIFSNTLPFQRLASTSQPATPIAEEYT